MTRPFFSRIWAWMAAYVQAAEVWHLLLQKDARIPHLRDAGQPSGIPLHSATRYPDGRPWRPLALWRAPLQTRLKHPGRPLPKPMVGSPCFWWGLPVKNLSWAPSARWSPTARALENAPAEKSIIKTLLPAASLSCLPVRYLHYIMASAKESLIISQIIRTL